MAKSIVRRSPVKARAVGIDHNDELLAELMRRTERAGWDYLTKYYPDAELLPHKVRVLLGLHFSGALLQICVKQNLSKFTQRIDRL